MNAVAISNNDMVYLVLGPWHHGQEIGDGSTLGALKFGSDTALYFRREILAPFLARYLEDDVFPFPGLPLAASPVVDPVAPHAPQPETRFGHR